MAEQVDVVVAGLGVAGEEVAGRLAQAGLSVVGIEARLVGGECPYWGCVPSKMMIRAGNLLAEARRIDGLAGIAQVRPDWAPVARRIRDEATDSWNDRVAVERFTGKGGRFVRGSARLVGPRRVEVNGEEYEASVSRVEPLAKTRDWQSPVKYFEATLSLVKDPGNLKPGQKVRAVVRLDEADGVLSIPRGALFEKDGKRVVYRRSGSGFEAVEVTTARQSISHLVVGSGLAAGDVIALRDPSASRSQASSASAGPVGPGT